MFYLSTCVQYSHSALFLDGRALILVKLVWLSAMHRKCIPAVEIILADYTLD